jgi:hypothetical protein
MLGFFAADNVEEKERAIFAFIPHEGESHQGRQILRPLILVEVPNLL